VLPLRLVVHFSTMMMHTAWLRLLTSFILVAPVARCSRQQTTQQIAWMLWHHIKARVHGCLRAGLNSFS
jgi:hypothetical protein